MNTVTCKIGRLTLVLALFTVVSVGAHGNRWGNRNHQSPRHRFRNSLVPAWLPRCFRASSFVQMYNCIQNNMEPECLANSTNNNNTDLQDIVDCIDNVTDGNINPPFSGSSGFRETINSTQVCFEPFQDCVNATIRDRIRNYKPCAKRALQRLNRCARRNRDICQENCTAVNVPETNSFSLVDQSDLRTCAGIQTHVVGPACEIYECCEPCVEEYETLMECVVNDALNYTSNDCEFTCPTTRADPELRRQLKEESDEDLEDEENQEITEACLQYAPGLTGQDAEELSVRAEFFVPCVYEEFVDVVLSEDDANPESGSMARNRMLAIPLAAFGVLFVWL